MIVLLVLTILVVLPAAAALLSETPIFTPAFGIRAPIVYLRQEISTFPGSDARDVCPSERGEFYYYNVVAYLRVTEVLDDGRVIAIARDNKRLCFWPNDSHFRKARIAERVIHRRRFPSAVAI